MNLYDRAIVELFGSSKLSACAVNHVEPLPYVALAFLFGSSVVHGPRSARRPGSKEGRKPEIATAP